IGSGMMGSALAFDLARSKKVEQVTLSDIDLVQAQRAAKTINSEKIKAVQLDVNYYDNVIETMNGHDCAIGAVSFRHNLLLSKAAIESGVHLCDLGGNDDVVSSQLRLNEAAIKNGVTIIPNCGLAPGLANILAARGVELFDTVDSVHMRVGGLPQHPRPPLNYQLVFSAEGLLNEYSGKSMVIRNGKMTQVDTLTEIETIKFPSPFGTLEAFHTSGGASLVPQMLEGKVRELDYKTIRYPGHCERFKALLDLGFGSNEPITIGSNLLTAKEFFIELLKKKLEHSGKDVVLLKVIMKGTRNNRFQALMFELIDFFDDNDNITAMMRMTAFPTSIIAQMIVEGVIGKRGVLTPEYCVPLHPLLEELKARNIAIHERWS
ncbi:MAG: saccharopine dehydrogenase NADP-binding domain-containing protein, partial [Ignavibacteriales bacterium]|nr:saccharopine dehydrogenase NADP-binding domain-containing protein [Ignavibacteriales bacterium]